ncbi:MAG: CHAT domain-containing protein [Chloroflexi bacterium]|nr:CHAT domain-containing protein [Chloroflexota bacterium]
MPTLRLTQETIAENQYRARLRLEGDGLPQEATAVFTFALTAQDREDLRWYLEDFLQYPRDPAPAIAARIEQRLADVGDELFRAIFQADDDARDLWATLRANLNNTRVEIVTGVAEAAAIPWELLRDPKTGVHLALRAPAFVRSHAQTAQKAYWAAPDPADPIRILLVICRPGGSRDVPFRSVASQLVKGLSDTARQRFDLDVLRPPTFAQLSQTLHQAKDNGRPYHIVHFDGHGAYLDTPESGGGLWRRLSPLLLSGQRTGKHGYLLFENPGQDENSQYVDGPALGKLLVDANVPVLVLNACRSAHADPPPQPETAVASAALGSAQSAQQSAHDNVRAFGSLAHEVIDAGVAGVVAMRYNVYVVTAAQFVADLYAGLVQGRPLGQAVTRGRQQLNAQPQREIGFRPLPLQDWQVPVVYEAAPLPLFPPLPDGGELSINLTPGESASAAGSIDQEMPPAPDVGFYGRDETLLALDRAFDRDPILLLHAFAGSGKTTTAAEFARWYSLTGGVDGPVLFTSFERYLPLPRVLDKFGQIFGPALDQIGVPWLALSDDDRRAVALQVMAQVPLLWIWDNVEPVSGFPTGAPADWTAAEQAELKRFLQDARQTKAKFLLTSRRDERGWLNDLPTRLAVPPMPFQERVQLARAIAGKQNKRLDEVEAWRPLLEYTQGNPLTLTTIVGQALRDGLTSKEQIAAYVAQLRRGEAVFADEPAQGRAKSLGASLSYGFAASFNDTERQQLALLHFFQGFVDVDALRVMGQPDADWALPALRGLTREQGIALLDRAAEVGLLTALGRGFYRIHPALPWYFRQLFEQYYGEQSEVSGDPDDLNRQSSIVNRQSPVRAFVEAMGQLGDYYHDQYEGGNRDVIGVLGLEEANLRHARRLARQHGWWGAVTSAMQGLRSLYDHTGRRGEWARLVAEIVPDFVDPATDGPLPGREEQWSLVTQHRVRLAREQRDWPEAERLQRVRVDWDRQRAAAALARPPAELTSGERNAIRTLAASLHELGRSCGNRKAGLCVVLQGITGVI